MDWYRDKLGIKYLSAILCLLAFQVSYAWDDEKVASMKLTPDLNNGKMIYDICTTCHQASGWADGSDISRQYKPGFFPQIAGQHVNVIIKQLVDIRAGNRDNPVMYPFTLDRYIGGTQGIADVSAYIATLKSSPFNNIGPGNDLALGKDLYNKNCKKCHGTNGEGSNEDFYPKIQGQHYNYLLRQFIWIRDGRRRNANEKMVEQVQRFSYKEIMAVTDYASRLKPASSEPEVSEKNSDVEKSIDVEKKNEVDNNKAVKIEAIDSNAAKMDNISKENGQ